MAAQLIALNSGLNILLDKPILLIGRDPECDIQLDSRKVSRRHCCIAQVNDYIVVRDLGSTNGIRINGVRVLEGKLKEGDEVVIGDGRFRLSWESRLPRSARQEVAPPRPARRPRTIGPVRADDDSLLEKCDEPIPLVDPADSLPIEPLLQQPHDSGPPILPEHIELAPSSSAKPPPEKPPG
jgi:predicted component of type VI protein secretion system